MAFHHVRELLDAPAGAAQVLQGNVAFALGCARGGIHLADGYPGTPSTEVIDKALRHLQDRMRVGWSVNEAAATALAFGAAMAGADAVVTMKIPGLFQAADVVATVAQYTEPRGGLVLYVASDFVPSSTQYLADPRYFLKSCFVPILEPRDHQELYAMGPLAARLSRENGTPVAVIASGLLCHSEGVVALGESRAVQRLPARRDFKPFMNLPELARRNYDRIVSERIPGVRRFAAAQRLDRIEWNDRSLGVITHGVTELYLKEVWSHLPVKPSVLSLGLTFPLDPAKARELAEGIRGPIHVLSDGLRFVEDELRALGIPVVGKDERDSTTEWTPDLVLRRLGGSPRPPRPASAKPVPRPPNICPGCPYRAFGLVVDRLRKKKKIVASFGDIGCNTLLYFLGAIDTCTCMGAADGKRQGVVTVEPELASQVISVAGDSTECHTGLASTRNAAFRKVPGVKVVLDNSTTAMTGGQPAPSTGRNLAGEPVSFDLRASLRAQGAAVREVAAFDMKAIERELKASLEAAKAGEYTVLVVRGPCIMDQPQERKAPRFELVPDRCSACGLCYVCSGISKGEDGLPHFTSQCNGCCGEDAVCVQSCHRDAFARVESPKAARPPLPAVEAEVEAAVPFDLPAALRVAIRGVGGQGNLFLGKVLAEVARLCGYGRIIKGETHGMAQLGGPVISTFGCGEAHSPVLAAGSADVLVALEESEVLRPGFLELLRDGGAVLLNRQRMIPNGLDPASYPAREAIEAALGSARLLSIDALEAARTLGDAQGRTVNVVALGALSALPPFDRIPLPLWRRALREVAPGETAQAANLAAFSAGRSLAEARG